MSDAVKPWDRAKPFKRINNDAFRPKDPADGLGADCGCQLPSQYPGLQDAFQQAFKNYKPDGFQSLIHTLHKISSDVKTGLTVAAAGIGALAGGVGALVSAVAAAKAVNGLVDDILNFTEEAIKELLSNIGLKLTEQAIRVLPHWVPVLKGASNERVGADQTVEVEGLAKRSYMNPIDVPFRQWHLWFNWKILLEPEPGYENAMTRAGNPPLRPDYIGVGDEERPISPDELAPGALEIQWDTGALWDQSMREAIDNDFEDHPSQIINYDGPMFVADWVWPMKNSHVWAVGRWVYDCSRTASFERPSDPPLMWTMVNPCKALATARWSAFKFEENDFAVPAIQLMFFACKRGGYIDYETIRDQDYEFIVDLPRIEMPPRAPLPIGHTGNFPHNTIVLRPRLLIDVDQKPFSWASSAAIEPIVTPIRPDDPQQPPSQVKVRVPLTSLPDNAEACGFVLTLGWFDPDYELAKRVKKIKTRFTGASGLHTVRNATIRTLRDNLDQHGQQLNQKILQQVNQLKILGFNLGNTPLAGPVQNLVQRLVTEILNFLQDISPGHVEQWNFRMGVNGQWKGYYRGFVIDTDPIVNFVQGKIPEFDLLQADDDLLAHEVNGVSWGPVGAFMRAKPSSRTLEVNGKAPSWPEIVNPDTDPDKAQQARLDMAVAYAIRLLHLGPHGMGLGMDNQPLGFVDPDSPGLTGPASPEVEGRQNPIDLKRAGNLVSSGVIEAPLLARAINPGTTLVEAVNIDGGKNKDYDIYYDVSIQDQKLS